MIFLKAGILFALPGLLIWLEKKGLKIITSLSVIVWCYLIGFLLNLANLGFDQSLAKDLAYLVFPVSLPLLLFEVNFRSWMKLAKTAVKGFLIAILTSFTILILIPILFFRDIPHIEKYAAMMSGMLTGGNVNFTALSMALEVDANAYIGLYTSESIIGAVYLLFLFKFSCPLLKRFFTPQNIDQDSHSIKEESNSINTKIALKAVCTSLLIVGMSLGLSKLIFGKLSPTFLILTITSLSLLIGPKSSFNKTKDAYRLGEYLLYVFCLSLGLLLDIHQLSKIGIPLFLFVSISYIGVIFIHFLLCRLFKVDGHTALITNVAGIFGPPFILPMAKVLKNESIVMSGLTTSLIGQALGTYVGFAVLYALRFLI